MVLPDAWRVAIFEESGRKSKGNWHDKTKRSLKYPPAAVRKMISLELYVYNTIVRAEETVVGAGGVSGVVVGGVSGFGSGCAIAAVSFPRDE